MSDWGFDYIRESEVGGPEGNNYDLPLAPLEYEKYYYVAVIPDDLTLCDTRELRDLLDKNEQIFIKMLRDSNLERGKGSLTVFRRMPSAERYLEAYSQDHKVSFSAELAIVPKSFMGNTESSD